MDKIGRLLGENWHEVGVLGTDPSQKSGNAHKFLFLIFFKYRIFLSIITECTIKNHIKINFSMIK